MTASDFPPLYGKIESSGDAHVLFKMRQSVRLFFSFLPGSGDLYQRTVVARNGAVIQDLTQP